MNVFKPTTGAHIDIRKRMNTYKREAIRAAHDLEYGPAVITQLLNSKTERQISVIMSRARKRKFKD